MSFRFNRFFDQGDPLVYLYNLVVGYLFSEFVKRVFLPKIKQAWSPRTKLYLIAYTGMGFSMLLPLGGFYVFMKFAMYDSLGLLIRPMSFELQLGFALWIVCGLGLLVTCARWMGIMHTKDKKFVPLIEMAYN